MRESIFQNAEIQLKELLSVADVGIWEWDIQEDFMTYSDEYIRMLGYSLKDMNKSLEKWEALKHPDDLPRAMARMSDYLAGSIPEYECEIRFKHHDGSYIWMRETGKIIAINEAGEASRLIGRCLDIDEMKRSEMRLADAISSLENNHTFLKNTVEKHTMERQEQDKLLWTISQISRKLLKGQLNGNFEGVVQDCLCLLGESDRKDSVYICKDDTDSTGRAVCARLYKWSRNGRSTFGVTVPDELLYDILPSFNSAVCSGRCLNYILRDFSDKEQEILSSHGIKAVLIVPITVGGNRWGFIGMNNCRNESYFTVAEENTLVMSGSLLANAIEKTEAENAVREMEERTQLMLNATPLCCNLWNPDFENMSCNDEAVRLFDLSSQKEYLDRFYELSPEYQLDGRLSKEVAAEWIGKAFREGSCRFEWMHQKLDGTPVPAEITLVRIKHRDGFIVAGYTRDLREQKAMLAELQAKEDLRRARDEALLNSKAKSNFLANMSHEIRTPLNAISGLAEIILRESTSEKTTEYATGIKGACGSLINLVNDILDISKIELGKLEISNASYELASLLNDVITISRMRLGGKPLMFTTDIDSRLPARLVGDEIRLKQILLNILSNAIKFTAEGYIALRVTGHLDGNRTTLSFSVKDSGIGIRQEDLELLFEEFERVNTTKNRSIEGTGLGLAISKQLCEMMGGYITVESTYGIGSEFTAVIPQECPSYERLALVKEEKNVLLYEPRERYRFSIAETLKNLDCNCVSCANQPELYQHIGAMPYDYILTAALHLKKVQTMVLQHKLSAPVAVFADYGENVSDRKIYTILFPVNCLQISALLNGYQEPVNFSRYYEAGNSFTAPSAKVLVVDDNPVNLQVAKGLMEPYQFMVDTAKNGAEAVDMIKQNAYDLVFMDHMMPVMDGVDATVAIRKLEGEYYENLPIIALTANALVGTREMFIREGMNDFLAKPIEINKLVHLLIKWLPESKIIKFLPEEESTEKEEIQAWYIPGVDTVKGISFVGGSKDNYLCILSTYYADGERKCSSLLQHISKNDFLSFRTEVHALKSASATIGALEISSKAARLEEAAQSHDATFIDSNFDEFLSCFQTLLEVIRVFLADSQPVKAPVPLDSRKAPGNTACFENSLTILSEAAELANIGLIEESLNNMLEFIWPDEVANELSAIQKYLSVFDYDSISECAARLKGCDSQNFSRGV